MKRLLDVVLGSALLIVAAPLIVFSMLVMAAVYRANPIFVHDRVGRAGRSFKVFKLRTLPATAPRYTDKHDLKSLQIHPAAALMRKFHVDELPQLWHVITGHMSLVGPRPEMAFLHDQMDPEFAIDRVSVTPGVTGLWQISVACAGLIKDSPEYDLAYLRSRSLRLDLWIMWRTALKMLGLSGPMCLSDVPAGLLADAKKGAVVQVIRLDPLDESVR